MNCHEVQELLLPYLHGELGRSERELIRAHLAECPGCQHELEVISDLQARVTGALQNKSSHVSPPPNSWSRLQAQITVKPQAEPSLLARARVRLRMPIAFIAASLSNLWNGLAPANVGSPQGAGSIWARGVGALFLVGVIVISTVLAASLVMRRPPNPIDQLVGESTGVGALAVVSSSTTPDADVNTPPKQRVDAASTNESNQSSPSSPSLQSNQPAQPVVSVARPVFSRAPRQAPFAPVDLESMREGMPKASGSRADEFSGPRPCVYCPRPQ